MSAVFLSTVTVTGSCPLPPLGEGLSGVLRKRQEWGKWDRGGVGWEVGGGGGRSDRSEVGGWVGVIGVEWWEYAECGGGGGGEGLSAGGVLVSTSERRTVFNEW